MFKKVKEKKTLVAVIIGSETNLPLLEESGVLNISDQCRISWKLSIMSADYNPGLLADYCQKARQEKVRSVITGVGMAGRLPGTMAAYFKYLPPIIGVVLQSKEFPNALDSLLSITRSPSGCQVLFAGIGQAGLKNAAIAAVQILANGEDEMALKIREKLIAYFHQNRKEPQIGLRKSQGKES